MTEKPDPTDAKDRVVEAYSAHLRELRRLREVAGATAATTAFFSAKDRASVDIEIRRTVRWLRKLGVTDP